MRLKRITTEYIDAEDRIRLNGQTAEGTVSVWVTQRLCNNLVKSLSDWLEQTMSTAPESSRKQMQSFAQHSADAYQQSHYENPVTPDNSKDKHKIWLAATINIKATKQNIAINMYNQGKTENVELSINTQQLRQWMGVLYKNYHIASWSTHAWPEWIQPDSNINMPARHPIH